MNEFAVRLAELKNRIPADVRIIAVSKTQPVAEIRKAYEAGQRDFGENKVQEILAKSPQLPQDILWHLIGHLQTNKVKQVLPYVTMIHAVDSARLLDKIQTQAAAIERVIPCLLQVHIASEETKFGLDPDELADWISRISPLDYPNIRFSGLMGMASFSEDENLVSEEFKVLHELFNYIQEEYPVTFPDFNELSMGMTGDYHLAIKHGSTMIRVGTLLFASRA